jgi:D-serine deaminase-like pyridoxal phosphate-dependent protein
MAVRLSALSRQDNFWCLLTCNSQSNGFFNAYKKLDFKYTNYVRFLIPKTARMKKTLSQFWTYSSSCLYVELVTLRLTVGQSVCLGIEHPCGTCDQISLPVAMLLSEICGPVSVGRPL